MGAIVESALQYADKGWLVIPTRGKVALLKGWPNKATTEPQRIKLWFEKYKNANVAVVTGRESGVVVIDIDNKSGRNGDQALRTLEAELGPLPDTYEVKTPNGRHLYVNYPEQAIRNSVNRIGDGLDIRGDGAYVIAPPSIVDARAYTIVSEVAPADLPPAWLAHIAAGQIASKMSIDEGARDDTLFREASRMRGKNYPYKDALELLYEFNGARCQPPLQRRQVKKCLDSAWKYRAQYEPNDLGNAQRLLDAVDGRLIFVPELTSFFVFDGYRWVKDVHDLISLRLLKRSNRRIHFENTLIDDSDQKKKSERFAVHSQNTNRLKAALESVKSEPDVAVRLDALDANSFLLGVENGVVNLLPGTFRAAKEDDFITKSTGCRYDRRAKCPKWLNFLNDTFNGNADLISYVQRAVGYSLTGSTAEQVLFAVLGPAGTGKTTFLEIIAEMLGDYAANTRTEVLMAYQRAKGGPSEDEARWLCIRFLTTNETSDESRFNQALIKDLTGGDRITARHLYQNSFEFRPQFKLWIRGNYKPKFDGEDTGMARRIKLIPFDRQVRPSRRDRHLIRKLRRELPGILNWAIDGCKQWQLSNLEEPRAIRKATAEYISEMDAFGQFLKECCQTDPEYRVPFALLYDAYVRWCRDAGHAPKTKNAVAEMLTVRGFRDTKFRNTDGKGVRGRLGIRVKPRPPQRKKGRKR